MIPIHGPRCSRTEDRTEDRTDDRTEDRTEDFLIPLGWFDETSDDS